MFAILCEDKTTRQKKYYRPFHDGHPGVTSASFMAHPFPVQPTKFFNKLKVDPDFKGYNLSIVEFPFSIEVEVT